jgi:hypothetical protein
MCERKEVDILRWSVVDGVEDFAKFARLHNFAMAWEKLAESGLSERQVFQLE